MTRNERGFSLAELLVAIAVLGFVMAGILALQQSGQLAYLTGAARVEVQQNARVALDLVMSELRSALSITAAANCNNAASGTDDITFVTQDNAIVRYRRNGTDLERIEGGVTTVVIGGLQSLQIRCFAADGTTLTETPADVRSIRINIATQTEKPAGVGSPSDQHAALEARVRLRNLL